jgi:hypothetical protein
METCIYIFTSPSNKSYIGQTLANTGRKHSEETKCKIGAASSLRNSGSGNPNYKPELHLTG